MLQTPEQALAVLNQFFVKHKEICQDDFNVAVLSAEINKHFSVAGEVVLSESTLELALLNVGPTLHYYADPSTTARIQQVSQQALESQQQLADELAEKNRKAEILRRELERDARQAARGPGRKSAYEIDPQEAARKQRDAQDAQKAIQRSQQHAAFLAELRDINMYLVTDSQGRIRHGATGDYKKGAKENLKRKYPAFAGEI